MASSRITLFFISLFCVIFCVNAGHSHSKLEADHGELPSELRYMAWIHRNAPADSIFINCGGAIVSDRHILSTASCIGDVKDEDRAELTAIFGQPSQAISGEIYQALIEHITVHPYYNSDDFLNDLAILQTKDRIAFSEFVAPIALPNVDFQSHIGVIVRLPSWNMTNVDMEIYNDPKVLQYLMLNCRLIHSGGHEGNRYFYTYMSYFALKTLLGSPLIKGDALIGIVSRPYMTTTGPAEMNVNVYKYTDWIRNEMNDIKIVMN